MNIYFPLRIISDKIKIDFMGIRFFNMALSLIMLLVSLFFIGNKGLNFGIDFKGGTIIEAKLKVQPELTSLYDELHQLNLGEIYIQNIDVTNLIIKLGSNDKNEEQIKNITILKDALSSYFKNDIEFTKVEFVGPQVGAALIKDGILAMLFSFAGIMCYIALRFEWQYGLGIIIALVHDTVFTLGFMSVTQLEFDLTSIAAILTVIGYSVNDSVVIYDRIRENILKYKNISAKEMINLSINETLSRTMLTVLTTLISVAALIVFGGDKLHSFSVTVFFGIVVGTYSSIYISAPILIHLGIKKFLR
ncbi:MAG: protein translocase subunit SecF [Rickettsiales bacterium]